MATAKPVKKAAKKAAPKAAAEKTGSATLPAEFFGIEPNIPVMHQVVTAQWHTVVQVHRAQRLVPKFAVVARSHSDKRETGGARQGSIRAPHFSGGAVALGPKPRKYTQRTPKKMIALALRSALSDRALEGKVVVVDKFSFDKPSTKDATLLLNSLGLDGKIMIVVDRDDEVASKSFRNLSNVQVVITPELNAYDILCNDWLVFTSASLPKVKEAAK
jgi:large subunit ribosomal protein L4